MPSSVDHHTQAQSLKAILAELSEAELIELIPQLAELLRRTGTEYWWMKKNVFDAFEAHGFHVTQDHFYSPQPTVASLAPDLWEGPRYPIRPLFSTRMECPRSSRSSHRSPRSLRMCLSGVQRVSIGTITSDREIFFS
jgi:hypothetical protein